MKTTPIVPARIEFDADPAAPPRAHDWGDVHHPQVGGLAQARHVFLGGNGLPQRWAGRARFVVLETGFGLGNNFIATWDAWRADPRRCERLVFVSIERQPPSRADLQRAHAGSPLPALAAALAQAWPALTPNLHEIDFEDGRVQLLLALGDAALLLPALRLAADAFFLDGSAPARNPQMWQPRVLAALGRKAAPGATLATWSVAHELRDGLAAAGFETAPAAGIDGKRVITVGRFAPRFRPRALPEAAVDATEAVVVGAGLAGACVAQALARQGLAVTVFDAAPAAAGAASGIPAGIFHGTLHVDDGPYARLYRAAALAARRAYAPALASGAVAGHAGGLLRLAQRPGASPPLAQLRSLLERTGLPADYVQLLDASAAGAHAGLRLARPAWLYPGGGWLSPADWVRHALAQPGVCFVGDSSVGGIAREGSHWRLLDTAGRALARAPLLVLACAQQAQHLLGTWATAGWPLRLTRGQLSWWDGSGAPAPALPRLPLAGDGYALALPGGGLLCGSTSETGDAEAAAAGAAPPQRPADQRRNLDRLLTLSGLAPPPGAVLQGRAGWRLHTADRLPICGAMPRCDAGGRRDQPRLLARESGLFVFTALGSRGLTLAPLLARLLAAQATGAPWPLEQDLADAVDPARWQVRQVRSAGGAGARARTAQGPDADRDGEPEAGSGAV